MGEQVRAGLELQMRSVEDHRSAVEVSRGQLAMVQAHCMNMLDKAGGGGVVKEHRLDDNTLPDELPNAAEEKSPSKEDMWDMDWSAVKGKDPPGSPTAGSPQ